MMWTEVEGPYVGMRPGRTIFMDGEGNVRCESVNAQAYLWKGVLELGSVPCQDVAERRFVWMNGDETFLCEDHYALFMEAVP